MAGSGLPTGSPLDGLLEAHCWYGKEFLDEESVHPLLFGDRSGRPRPIDPRWLPMAVLRDYAGFAHFAPFRWLFTGVRSLLWTTKPAARLRTIEHRGVLTAAIVYDALPVIDVFRRVGPDVLLGADGHARAAEPVPVRAAPGLICAPVRSGERPSHRP